jgi:murein DD-endopeptidase MepM/ murein hydrolase activator NlpD
MHSYRTTARGVILLLLLGVLAGTAWGGGKKGVPDFVFPVVGDVQYTNDFGDPRGQGAHEGNDIMADWRAPVVAVEDGRVRFHTGSRRAGCMLYLYGQSGTTYLYVHLNNDLTPKSDDRGGCVHGVAFARGLEDGMKVKAGQLIAYVGDSGDAEGIHHHLHFEVHPNDGGAVSPYGHLKRALRLLYAAPLEGESLTLALYGTVQRVEEGLVTMKLERLRGSDGSQTALARELVVAVPAGSPVERAGTNGRRPAALGSAKPGERIVVWTAPVPSAFEAQAGQPGSLRASSVLYRGDPV